MTAASDKVRRDAAEVADLLTAFDAFLLTVELADQEAEPDVLARLQREAAAYREHLDRFTA